MNSMPSTTVRAITLAAAIAAVSTAIASPPAATRALAEAPFVQVRIPQGLTTDFPSTQPATNGTVYVTIPSVRAVNRNSHDYAPYEPRDFHLVADGVTYYPVVRPGLGALDLSTAGIVAPRGALLVTVTFQVPATVTVADFEFVPHWFDDSGASVAFCCLYQ